MVEKLITPASDVVVEFARYRRGRNPAGMTLAISARCCRHCGAALSEDESEDECSSAFNSAALSLRDGLRKFYAD